FPELDGAGELLGAAVRAHGVDAEQPAVTVTDKLLAGDGIGTGVGTEAMLTLDVAVVFAIDLRPQRPGVVLGALHRRTRHDLEVDQRLAPMPQRGGNTVGAGVTATNDNDVLVLGADVVAVFQIGVQQTAGVLGQKVHREVDAVALATRNVQVAWLGGASRQTQGIDLGQQLFHVNRIGAGAAHVGVDHELHALRFQQLHATVDHLFLQLHVGDAVHQQSADAVRALVYRDLVPGLVQLGGSGQSGGPGADDRDFLACAERRRIGHHPAVLEALVDDRLLDVLDGHRWLVNTEHARPFAGCGADAAGELREVVGLVQAVERLLPAAVVDEIVPLGDQVVYRAPFA